MTSRADEQLARQVNRLLRTANANADRREREEDAKARARARAGKASGKMRGGGGGKQESGQSSARPFRLPHARTHSSNSRAPRAWSRQPRAPRTASMFRFERKYSNRAGAHGSPSSAVGKVIYDHDMNGNPEGSRVLARIVVAPDGTPTDALDPIRMAEEAERTAGRQSNSRMMAHDTVSLPKDLTDEQRAVLTEKIAQRVSDAMGGVPVYAAVHVPDGKNQNHHVHLSCPLRHVIDDGEGAFHLGERVPFEQRPKWREAHGLPPTNHTDLKSLRADIADECGNALKEAGADHHVAERWRHGYLRLNVGDDNQVSRAKERGDADFVKDNEYRETQRHEGPGRRRDGTPTPAQEHNQSLEKDMSANLLAGRILTDTIKEAKESGATGWEDVRKIAARRGARIDFVRRRHKGGSLGKVTGWKARVAGSTVTGQQAGMTLRAASRDLQEAGLPWAKEAPVYQDLPNYPMEQGAVQRVVEAIQADTTQRGPAVQQAAKGGAQQAKPAEEGVRISPAAPQAPAPVRAPRASTSDRHKKEMPPMNVDAIIKELSTLPPEPAPSKAPTPASRAEADPAPRTRLDDLNDFEKSAMIMAYPDQREIQRQQRRVISALEKRKTLLASEPSPTTGLIFKKPSPAHRDWHKRVGEMNRCVQMTRQHVEKWLDDHVYSSPELTARIQQQRQEREDSRRQAVLQEYEKTQSILGGQNVYNRPMYQQSQARRLRENPWLAQMIEERAKAETAARAEAEKQAQRQIDRYGQAQGGSARDNYDRPHQAFGSQQPARPRG